jgi:predicted nucleic acid-binding protein
MIVSACARHGNGIVSFTQWLRKVAEKGDCPEPAQNLLNRPHLASRLAQQQSSVAQALASYDQLVTQVVPRAIEPTSRDPDDDHVIACALAAKAQLIVSGDRDLLVLEAVREIAIVTPAQAIACIEAGKQ